MTVLAGLADLLGWAWRRRVCQLIEWLRPGRGHDWLEACDPPLCRWCGDPKPSWRLP